jgi:hypothetical protein
MYVNGSIGALLVTTTPVKPPSHRGGPGSIPGQLMWQVKWPWDKFLLSTLLLLRVRKVLGSNLDAETGYTL